MSETQPMPWRVEADTLVYHRFVSRPERIFDYFPRHSLHRPRDLMFIGGEIVKITRALE